MLCLSKTYEQSCRLLFTRVLICQVPTWCVGFGVGSSGATAGSGALGCSQGCLCLSRGKCPNFTVSFCCTTGHRIISMVCQCIFSDVGKV